MNSNRHRPSQIALLSYAALAAALTAALPAQGTRVGFEEAYALAADRSQTITTLIPGTEEWYYYQCRERLDARDFATVQKLLGPWIQRHGRTPRVIEIENREALLGFDNNREKTFELLRQRLGLSWNHQRSVPGEQSDLPTRLDEAMLAESELARRALAQSPGTVDGFEDRALAALAASNLDADRLHSLLGRLQRPDVDNLPALIVRDLDHPQSRGFGSLGIHGLLRHAQLEECAGQRPALLNDGRFIEAMLLRMAPSADTVWQRDPAQRLLQLRRLHAFAQRLAPAHNSLKAHVLFHWLQHDLSQGTIDKERFLAYIRLPRRDGHVAAAFQQRFERRSQEFVDHSQRYPTGLPSIGNDEALVRAILEHFFATEDVVDGYAEFLDRNWLQGVLAETKILRGTGDQERWYSLLNDPQRLEQIEKRVEITFAPTQPTNYGADDSISLDVDTKNVPTLLVKVFVIDSYRYLVEKQKDVDATIELDGLVANHEQTYDYTEPSLHRVRRHFDLPMLREPGTYVVELVGNGISSRAVIHKGSLRHVERTHAAGHVFRVYDEAGAHQKGALVWFGGREYTADKDGEVLVPFSTEPGTKKAVLRVGNRASLISFAHRSESFELRNSVFVERESLIAGQTARVVVRPQLRIDGNIVSLKLMTEPVLVVTAVDLDGIRRVEEVRDLTVLDGQEIVHQITVPERLASIEVSLRGKARDLSGKDITLTASSAAFAVNGIDSSTETMSSMLVPTTAGYAIELRGKNGEAVAGRSCELYLKHRNYRQQVVTSLQTGSDGRIGLGRLQGIEKVEVHISGGMRGIFELGTARANVPPSLHGRLGQTLRLPYLGKSKSVTRQEFSLLGNDEDAFANLALANGFLELRDLRAGDYALHLHETGEVVPVRVTAGAANGNWLLGRDRTLEASTTAPLHLRAMAIADGELRIGITNFTPNTRVHVVTTRFAPTFDAFTHLRGGEPAPLISYAGDNTESSYHAGRKLGDEYRYVLERRFASKFPGNMLQRPSLLLNPWALERNSWNSAVGLGGGAGGRYGGRGGAGKARGHGSAGRPGDSVLPSPGTYANLDYFPAAAATLYNLRPDAAGVVHVKVADLGEGHLVHVVAVDGDEALYDMLVRDEQPLRSRSRTLAKALPATDHLVEQKRIEFVAGGGTATIGDARSADVEIFDSLSGAFRLMATLSGNGDLAKFAFVLRWPELTDAEKRTLYSEHACHELHFFLYQKDRAFFDAVVKPYLGNKQHKTFLDHWLLGSELRGYLEPWSFARLNLVEKILLAQRLDGSERAVVARLLREQLELVPIDRDRIDKLFDTALAVNELAEGGESLRRNLASRQDGPADNVPPPASAAPAAKAGAPAEIPSPDAGGGRNREALKEEQENKPAGEPATGSEGFFLGAVRKSADNEKDKKLADDVELRGLVANLYRAVQPTKVLAESNYWRIPLEATSPDAVRPSRFWVDYATASSTEPFVSPAFVETSNSFLEMMFALSVLDLPFTPGKHEVVADGDHRTLRAATPLLLVRKEVTPTAAAEDEPPLLLGENFFRQDERYHFVDGVQRETFVTDEFLTGIAYGAQVVVSNPTGQPRTIDVLLQVPAGAIPVQRGFWTRSVALALNPYETKSLEYLFYFPAAGDFEHYPAHAATKGKLVAAATPRTLHTVTTPSRVDTRSWEHVSQQGTPAEVMSYLENNNVHRLDLAKIAWRLADREFFTAITKRLRTRHIYDTTLWSYAVLHRDVDATREYLRHQDGFLQTCGAALNSQLVTIDPIERGAYQQLELDPIVHARAHRLGSDHIIGNSDLAQQYAELMDVLGYHQKLTSEDWLAVTYYLLLQDRIEEALASFAKVDQKRVDTRVQYDYLAAYLCFFTADTQRARRIAEGYREHPVQHWQKRFRDVLAHLDEAEGKAGPTTGEPGADALAATAPAIEMNLDGRMARLAYKNLARCEVRYYELDVEFAFSAQPFASTSGTAAAYVQPNLREERDLPKDGSAIAFELPPQFHTKNVLVEVRAGGLTRSQTYFANTLDVRFLESYGQIAVADPKAQRPLPKTYVKVFARLPNGQVRFHKDGYTDLRGRFDYASLSDDPNAGAQRYAVLVLSEQFGAVIREVAPPVQ